MLLFLKIDSKYVHKRLPDCAHFFQVVNAPSRILVTINLIKTITKPMHSFEVSLRYLYCFHILKKIDIYLTPSMLFHLDYYFFAHRNAQPTKLISKNYFFISGMAHSDATSPTGLGTGLSIKSKFGQQDWPALLFCAQLLLSTLAPGSSFIGLKQFCRESLIPDFMIGV